MIKLRSNEVRLLVKASARAKAIRIWMNFTQTVTHWVTKRSHTVYVMNPLTTSSLKIKTLMSSIPRQRFQSPTSLTNMSNPISDEAKGSKIRGFEVGIKCHS